MLIRKPDDIRGSEITDKNLYENRRQFLKLAGLTTISSAASLILSTGCTAASESAEYTQGGDQLDFQSSGSTLGPYDTDEEKSPYEMVTGYNNFYEFTKAKDQVRYLVNRFKVRPWSVEVKGLVENPGVFDPDDLVQKMPLEERLYRFRCVEAWAMAVPWTGFPFKAMIDQVKPKSTAKYIRMVSFNRPEQALGQNKQPWLPWPYFEGLTIEEAMNELAFLATGIYGHELPKQHGAPIRLVVPWKYGFKSIKSIVLIEFIGKQPRTFWNQIAPGEYDFLSNVNPSVPHPRWSQETERMIDTGTRVATQIYNGYGEYVTHLY